MSKVSNCALKSVGQLDFDYSRPNGCNSFSFGIMLCFPRRGAHIDDLAERECYSLVPIHSETWVNTLNSSFDDFDGFGTTFKKEPPTQFWHYRGALGNYKGSPFAVGSSNQSMSMQTEILDYEKGKWVRGEDYKNERRKLNYYFCEFYHKITRAM